MPLCPLTTAEPHVGIPLHADLTALSRSLGLPASRLLGFSFSTLTLPISSHSQYNPLIEGWKEAGKKVGNWPPDAPDARFWHWDLGEGLVGVNTGGCWGEKFTPHPRSTPSTSFSQLLRTSPNIPLQSVLLSSGRQGYIPTLDCCPL